ncbi:expressed unknown protein [Seminavis robusta]|uniref:Uncharacterized protein n=1 Tax=Seminavis robusta TaxID=568900 RepID=A0A9N8HEB5_9STRA|nr:expressed unknown protein [Seminavis robusta]|eukprot:Sro297_g110860.1 n/a (207) ;mRNA; r:20849-21469
MTGTEKNFGTSKNHDHLSLSHRTLAKINLRPRHGPRHPKILNPIAKKLIPYSEFSLGNTLQPNPTQPKPMEDRAGVNGAGALCGNQQRHDPWAKRDSCRIIKANYGQIMATTQEVLNTLQRSKDELVRAAVVNNHGPEEELATIDQMIHRHTDFLQRSREFCAQVDEMLQVANEYIERFERGIEAMATLRNNADFIPPGRRNQARG